jgi:hypothetical protein
MKTPKFLLRGSKVQFLYLDEQKPFNEVELREGFVADIQTQELGNARNSYYVIVDEPQLTKNVPPYPSDEYSDWYKSNKSHIYIASIWEANVPKQSRTKKIGKYLRWRSTHKGIKDFARNEHFKTSLFHGVFLSPKAVVFWSSIGNACLETLKYSWSVAILGLLKVFFGPLMRLFQASHKAYIQAKIVRTLKTNVSFGKLLPAGYIKNVEADKLAYERETAKLEQLRKEIHDSGGAILALFFSVTSLIISIWTAFFQKHP